MTTDMQRLNTLVHEQLMAEEEVAQAEKALATAKKKLARLSEYVIPDYCEESLDFYAKLDIITKSQHKQ